MRSALSSTGGFDIRVLSPRLITGLKLVAWVVALVPFMGLVIGVINADLGPNPIETITRTTGWYALVLLCVTLAITPLRRLTQWAWWLRLRRSMGLFAFFYASLHLLAWLWFEHYFMISEMLRDVFKRPFIAMGMAAFVLMLPLAATSTHGAIRWLGGRRWQKLHRLVYVVAVVAVAHFWWMRSGKHDMSDPAGFAAIVTVLLGARWWWRYGEMAWARVSSRWR